MHTIYRGELACREIHHRGQRLVVAEQGAQVLEYQRDGEPPIIWLSEQASYQRGQSVRGGIPLCWPWFGTLARNPEALRRQYPMASAPAHGLVRQQPWQLVEQQQDQQRQTLVWRLAGQADSMPLPGLTPTLSMTLDDGLTLSLDNHNHGNQSACISQALHSYFAVSDIHQVHVYGLEDCPYVDALDDWQRHQQAGPVRFHSETDRLYLQLPTRLHIDDPLWQRRLVLESQGSQSAVVWNPWVEKSRRLSQFADHDWQRMLCIETARVLENALTLGPGEHHRMAVRFVTEPL
ncbi:MAG: D-hexose-6-phosphate mutarotase [Alcanivorax sp.]|nr:D-hexose-6-phosphate mutarotase [Alcanivorax sp.]